jgi:hypothetical protein
MFSSRTDKAHSQNGETASDRAWLDFLRRDANSAKLYHRPAAKAETRAIIRDELFPPKRVKTPGLKRIAAETERINDERRTARLNDWAGLEHDRLTNLSHIEVAFQWRETRLSACNWGCKEYERTNNGVTERQVLHNSVYGCSLPDGPIERDVPMPDWERELLAQIRVEHHAPKRQPIKHFAPKDRSVGFNDQARREGSLPIAGRNIGCHHANFDVESPSLMQMAAARAKNLGISA